MLSAAHDEVGVGGGAGSGEGQGTDLEREMQDKKVKGVKVESSQLPQPANNLWWNEIW